MTHPVALVPPTGPAPPALEAALQGVATLALLGHFPAATGRRHGLVAGAARPRVARVAARVVTAGQGLAAGVPTAGRRLRAGEVEGGLAAGAAGANSKVRRHTRGCSAYNHCMHFKQMSIVWMIGPPQTRMGDLALAGVCVCV